MDLDHVLETLHDCPPKFRREMGQVIGNLLAAAEPQRFEYEVYYLDEEYNCLHKGEVLLATNNLAIACSWCYEYYEKFNIAVCVYQPKHHSYRELYAPWIQPVDTN